MHSEDYVHRIGRTGRAHAIGDAISFITPEDQGPLRSLERFIGRGIVRKKATVSDYNQAAPPGDERRRGARVPQRKIEPRLQEILRVEAAMHRTARSGGVSRMLPSNNRRHADLIEGTVDSLVRNLGRIMSRPRQ